MGVEFFSTQVLKPAKRLSYWNQITNEVIDGTRICSDDEQFAAQMWRRRLGDLVFLRPKSPRAAIERAHAAPDAGSGRVMMHLQHRGSSRNRQGKREAELGAGDLTIVDAKSPYRLDLSANNEALAVEMPWEPLSALVPNLGDQVCARVSGASPSVGLLHDFLLSFWRRRPLAEDAEETSQLFYQMMALALRSPPADRPAQGQVDRLLAIVEANLTDPGFNTVVLAELAGMSPRSVQMVFARLGETPSRYIVRRRVEVAAEILTADPTLSITDVAFEMGFNDSGYFSRCFRAHKRQAPSQFASARSN